MSQTHPHILRRIEAAKEQGLTALDLSYEVTHIPLMQVPPEIFDAKQLTHLDLNGQRAISILPEALLDLPNLTHLDLRSLRLQELPPWIRLVVNLTSLGLSWRKTAAPPTWFLTLEQLHLDLSFNRLSELPAWLGQLSNLTGLSLGFNRLSELPAWLGQLSNLTGLSLGFNRLSELPAWLGQLSNLTRLDLSGNRLSELPEELSQLRKLASLDLGPNDLSELPEWLGQLSHLTRLNLGSNDLSELPEWLGNLSNLTHLDLRTTILRELPAWLGQLSHLTRLNLGSNDLRELPEWLGQLSHLTHLNLSRTNLSELPEELSQLRKLASLDLGLNDLRELPAWLGQLSHLTRLDLSGNRLSELPAWLGQLSNLTSLDLRDNELRELPAWLGQLSHLTSLDLGNTGLSELPEWLGQLSHLTSLDLRDNKLSELPEWLGQLSHLTSLDLSYTGLSELPEWLGQLSHLTSLKLDGSPIETPPLEALGLDALGWANIENIRNYFRQLQEEGVSLLYEAKLLIIGSAGAGKTSLTRKIVDPAYQLVPDEVSTEGIEVSQWEFLMDDAQPFRINIWDFGGQEIYHATHQFFLTKRSLYALVADTRKEDTDFEYWLNAVELFGENSPLLIVKNEKQDRHIEINEPHLRGQFGHLKETLATNLADNRGLAPIRDCVKYNISHLPHIGDALPKTWVNVRQALEDNPNDYIGLNAYLDICEQHGIKRLAYKLQLSDYLHDLGICLHFQNDPLLKQTVILKPQWGTDAVYRILDNEQVIQNFGRFTQVDLERIWGEENYAAKQAELLRLMINFQLCYEIPDNRGTYIAPQLLTKVQPDYDWNETDNLILSYTYEFMPKGVLTRFIVAMHSLIAQQNLVWRSGMVLAKDETLAEVIEFHGRRMIRIRVVGNHKRDLLTIITHELDKIHRSFKRLKFRKLIPCNCDHCRGSQAPHFYDYDSLRNRLANERYEVECDKSYEMVAVQRLIDDVGGTALAGRRVAQGIDIREERVESLQVQLAQHYRNLNQLQEQAAKLGPSAILLGLQSQIKDEQVAIERLEGELEGLLVE